MAAIFSASSRFSRSRSARACSSAAADAAARSCACACACSASSMAAFAASNASSCASASASSAAACADAADSAGAADSEGGVGGVTALAGGAGTDCVAGIAGLAGVAGDSAAGVFAAAAGLGGVGTGGAPPRNPVRPPLYRMNASLPSSFRRSRSTSSPLPPSVLMPSAAHCATRDSSDSEMSATRRATTFCISPASCASVSSARAGAGPRRAARRGPDRRDTRAFASPTLVLTLFALPERFHEPAEWAFAMRARPPAVAGARARAGGMDTARACIFSMRATDRGSSGRALTCDPSVPVSGCFFAQKRIR